MRGFTGVRVPAVMALTVQIVLPVAHLPVARVHGAERSESGLTLPACAGSVVGLPGKALVAGSPSHDTESCAACRMLRHASHGLAASNPGVGTACPDAGRWAFRLPCVSFEFARPDNPSRAPPLSIS